MEFRRVIALCVLSLSVAACGGGGGGDSGGSGTTGGTGGTGGNNSPPPPPPPPEPVVTVSVSSGALDLVASEGDELPVSITTSWTATDLPTTAGVYLQLVDADSRFQLPAPPLSPGGGPFTFNVKTASTIAKGSYQGTILVRACKDSACAQRYTGTDGSVKYTVNVSTVPDWETHQRDAAHTGYMPMWLDSSKFARAWEWQRPADPEPLGGINPPVARKGVVYVSKDVYFGEGIVFALNQKDGAEIWHYDLGGVPALGPPALSGGKIFVATTGQQDTFLWSFDAATGASLNKSPFEGQWPHTLAPTVYGERAYVGAGYFGGITYSFSTVDGTRTWEYNSGGAWDMFTPAVDANYLYHYDGAVLRVVDKATGTAARSITDPAGAPATGEYFGSPILGSRSNVVAFAGGAFSGRASSNVEQYEQRVLSSFDVSPNGMKYEWSTASQYLTVPAVADGLIYAARNAPMSLDAIDEKTGAVVWSWTPTSTADTGFHRNIVVTRNLLFVSTDATVYALDRKTHAVVWSQPEPGMLTISPDRMLYIATTSKLTGGRESNGKLVAFKLQ